MKIFNFKSFKDKKKSKGTSDSSHLFPFVYVILTEEKEKEVIRNGHYIDLFNDGYS